MDVMIHLEGGITGDCQMSTSSIVEDWIEEEPEVFDRIVSRPDLLGGKPCIAGSRISVQFVLERLAAGDSTETIVKTYPNVDPTDIKQAILFAASYMSAVAFSDRMVAG
jgi:uncharacterized protein (DUF433 family)